MAPSREVHIDRTHTVVHHTNNTIRHPCEKEYDSTSGRSPHGDILEPTIKFRVLV